VSERLINEHEAAQLLGLSVATLRNWRFLGAGPKYYKLGRAVRYDRDDLRAFAKPVEPRRQELAGACA
jgi:predicted DNA-binding transcriptional regulator AlpA